ncbi:MAG: DNA methyltransferase [Acidimicrobiales bacterium]
MTVRVLAGDIIDQAAQLDDGSIDLVFTSPPFWRQRAYLPDSHPDKHREIGTEPSPGAFVDRLLDVVEALTPKLAGHGSMMFELGDTMAGSGGAGGDYNPGGARHGQPRYRGTAKTGKKTLPGPGSSPAVPLDKSLCLIPELFRVALVYGRNPLTGRTTPSWRARNVVRWARNNPPVGSLGRRDVEHHTGDARYRPATTDLVVICKNPHRYFDLQAVTGHPTSHAAAAANSLRRPANRASAPPLDHWWWHPDDDGYEQDTWLINTRPYHGAHHATMPLDLPVIPILSMCPQRVCRICGHPSERITSRPPRSSGPQSPNGARPRSADGASTTLGWTECGCGIRCVPTTWDEDPEPDLDTQEPDPDAIGTSPLRDHPARRINDLGSCNDPNHWRPGTVLDPFGGSGTTALVAESLGRDCILVDLDERNTHLALTCLAGDVIVPVQADVNIDVPPQLSLFAPASV